MARRNIGTASERDRLVLALEADLRANLPAALALNGMGGFLWDLTAGLIFADAGALAVFGLEPGEFDGRLSALKERIVPEEVPRLRKLTADAFAGSANYAAYFRVRPPRGGVRWAHSQAAIQRDGAGKAVRAVGIIRDASAELRHDPASRSGLRQDEPDRCRPCHHDRAVPGADRRRCAGRPDQRRGARSRRSRGHLADGS